MEGTSKVCRGIMAPHTVLQVTLIDSEEKAAKLRLKIRIRHHCFAVRRHRHIGGAADGGY